MKNKIVFIFTVTTFFLAAHLNAQQSIFRGLENVEPVREEVNEVLNDWQNFYFSKEDCGCVYGDEFFISIKSSTTKSQNLMISLQGGGACWPDLIRCKPAVTDEDVRVSNFATELAERLKSDWNQVVIPYCDGSVYLGDNKNDYNNDGDIDHVHKGLNNSVAALNLVKDKFPEVNRLFITGCSAGGYGTIIQSGILKYLYPDASIYILNESGPGLLKPDPEFWEVIDSSWNLSQLMPENCKDCEGQLIYWYKEILKDPKVKIGLYSSYEDQVIGQSFLNLAPEDFKELLLKTSGDLASRYPDQFKRYFVNGKTHCIAERNIEVNGVNYWDWVESLINDGDNWKDILE